MLIEPHNYDVSHLCVRLGERLAFDYQDLERLRVAGLYHDAAKQIDANFYTSMTGIRLLADDPAWSRIRLHPALSAGCYELVCSLSKLSFDPLVHEAILGHHIDFDDGKHGRGYPLVMLSEDGYRLADVLRIVDSFSAGTGNSLYGYHRKDPEMILHEIECDAGVRYRTDYALTFCEMMRQRE